MASFTGHGLAIHGLILDRPVAISTFFPVAERDKDHWRLKSFPELDLSVPLSEVEPWGRLIPSVNELNNYVLEWTERGWEFPKTPFVSYGPEDEWWARKCGFGKQGWVHRKLPFKGYLRSITPTGKGDVDLVLVPVEITQ